MRKVITLAGSIPKCLIPECLNPEMPNIKMPNPISPKNINLVAKCLKISVKIYLVFQNVHKLNWNRTLFSNTLPVNFTIGHVSFHSKHITHVNRNFISLIRVYSNNVSVHLCDTNLYTSEYKMIVYIYWSMKQWLISCECIRHFGKMF